MQTVNDVVKAVLANPDAYTDAFPVSSAQVEEQADFPSPAFHEFMRRQMDDLHTRLSGWPMNSPADEADGAQLTPEVLEGARVALQQNTLHRNSIANRIANDADRMHWSRYYQLPRFTDGDTQYVLDEAMLANEVMMIAGQRVAGSGLENDEPVTNEVCRRCSRPRLCVRRLREVGSGPTDSYEFVCLECIGPYRTATGAQAILDEARRSFDRSSEMLQQQADPHTRTAPGQCACGFTSMFTGDMDAHLGGQS